MTNDLQHIDGIQRTIIDNLNTSVLLLDHNLTIQYLNPAGENLFHISNKRAGNLNLNSLIFIEDYFINRLQQVLRDFQPFSEHEVSLQISADKTIIIDYKVSPVISQGKDTLLLVEITNMDRQLRIAREEKLLNEQSATRNLVRGMAHEIKNPLGGLRGAAQLLERELPNEDLKEYTQIIIGEADRLQNLVDRMLGPSNLPRLQTINIHQVMEHVRHLVQAESPETLYFKLDYDPSLPELNADPDLLIQAILNITRNAAAALNNSGEITYKTRPQRHFTIGHKHHRLVMQIDIMDNGPGIPSELVEQIFYPMVTGRADGTGLGLSIAQSLITQHKGLIECHSEPGNTVFTIYLPLETSNG